MSVTISVNLDTRRLKRKTGKYPVKILVTYNRNSQRHQTIYDLTQDQYNNLSVSRVAEKMQKVRDNLKLIQRNGEVTANALTPFSFEEFEKDYIYNNPLFRQRKYIKDVIVIAIAKSEFDFSPFYKKFSLLTDTTPEPGTIGFTYLSYIKKLLQENRISTAVNYSCSYRSLLKFRGNVHFTNITVSFLHQYEQWAKQGGYV